MYLVDSCENTVSKVKFYTLTKNGKSLYPKNEDGIVFLKEKGTNQQTNEQTNQQINKQTNKPTNKSSIAKLKHPKTHILATILRKFSKRNVFLPFCILND